MLPIRDPEANYSNGGGRGLRVLAVRDDGTVVLSVAVFNPDDVRVVVWDPDTGDLHLVARSEEWPSIAPDVLR